MNATHEQSLAPTIAERWRSDQRGSGRRGILARPPFVVGRVRGVEVRVHLVWLVGVPLVGLLAAVGRESLPATLAYLLLPVVWALSVLAHEAGHALMAGRLSHRVESVSLLPMGGATAYDGPPERARDQMLISGSGPLTSLLLAVLPALVGVAASGGAREWWLQVASFNAAVFVWNALPALPLDGGRVVQAALRTRGLRTTEAARDARHIGQATAYTLGAAAGAMLVTAPVNRVLGITMALTLFGTGLTLLQVNGTHGTVVDAAPGEVTAAGSASK